ncbi:hypothetical protein ACUW9V_000882 [Staphylococcus epidermidis]|jgi:hypothetical protein|uniref:hypothetical protein n=1 Tax=Staphylococcus TaxID=1279 RepID=UPI0002D67336|nr:MULTISPECIES: hypothetical protein [Staphylococcus]DAK13616.1 MAG TPA: hypothetical protein [Caudoviricetes sp.]MBC2966016.1 hypothetical protein [Staphylococcus epidermidis]MBC3110179.1 hypothetical protein [Staphylococcus epidermidis]MBM0767911.1 hypothetical protein [Staphylococcus epidermidis]MBM0777139.1 hypothetical protein [Staphylococcus epidermidis]
MKKVNEVYETTNYNIFKFSEFNRNVVYRKDLMDEAKRGFIAPVIVNEDFVVIDGQSRLKHAEYAQVPIKYMVVEGLTEKDIVRMNTTQLSWSIKDYIQSYANEGNRDYQKLIELLNEYNYTSGAIAAMCLGINDTGSKVTNILKNGEFKFVDYDGSLRFLEYYKRFLQEASLTSFGKLLLAVNQICKIKKLDKERLIKKVKESRNKDDLNISLPKNEYIEILLDMYNNKVKANSKTTINYYKDRKNQIIIDAEMED